MSGAVFTTPAAQALGHAFEVATPDRDLTDYLGDLFSSLPPASPDPPHHYELSGPDAADRWRLSRDGLPILEDGTPAHAVATLLWRINLGVVEDTDDLVLLHAGAVDLAGVRVLLPGDTEVGKSTLVTGLMQAGAGYFGDEVVGLDLDANAMHGYAKPVSLDAGSWPLFSDLEPRVVDHLRPFLGVQWHVQPRAIPGVEVMRRARPDLVVLPNFRAHAPTQVEPIRAATALGMLAACAFKTSITREQRLTRLARLVEQTPCFQLTFGTLEAGVDAVRALARAVTQSDRDLAGGGGDDG